MRRKPKAKPKWKTEAELAASVIELIREQGWEVYQEVGFLNSCADIVATRGGIVWVIECKLTLGFDVMEQAEGWKRWAHYVSVAVPPTRSHSRFAERILKGLGIGCIRSAPHETKEVVPAELNRKALAKKLSDKLCEEHKTFASAGSAAVKRWTPFKATTIAVQNYVKLHPGTTMKELVSNIKTHYNSETSAAGAISHYIKEGIIPGIRVERDGRSIRLYEK